MVADKQTEVRRPAKLLIKLRGRIGYMRRVKKLAEYVRID